MVEPHAFRLPHRVASGSWNMAADAALLDWVARGSARLLFRTYEWQRPTLSLGRTEPYPEGWNREAIARSGVEVVRRPTGGNAVLHVEEVTFALAASVPGPWALTPRAFANAVAEALARALRACGLAGATLADPSPLASGSDLCFARSAPGEVLARGYKVAGIASRFARQGALCHASVPLTARSRSIAGFRSVPEPHAEALDRNARSVGELIEAFRGDLPGAVREALAAAVAARFGVRWSESSFEAVGIGAIPVLPSVE